MQWDVGMSYRSRLPQLDGDLFLTDGGIETTLIFLEGIELPSFASFVLLSDSAGTEALRRYFEPYVALARDQAVGFVLESPTWRASASWGAEIGYTEPELTEINRKAIALMASIRDENADGWDAPIVISGCVGPQDDGYNPQTRMTPAGAEEYHSVQIRIFADTEADMVTALTMTYVEEAMGVANAARRLDMPVAISFTVETDGRLPSGQPLGEAIEQVDAETGDFPAYFMINCAHPTHFEGAIDAGGPWTTRIRGLRANASTRSHAELDESTELDAGDPVDLGRRYAALRLELPYLNVLGGCCGTDDRHVAQIYQYCSP
jgi:S-methylmethionine-dependent homocysteine/selenocysteine methylase